MAAGDPYSPTNKVGTPSACKNISGRQSGVRAAHEAIPQLTSILVPANSVQRPDWNRTARPHLGCGCIPLSSRRKALARLLVLSWVQASVKAALAEAVRWQSSQPKMGHGLGGWGGVGKTQGDVRLPLYPQHPRSRNICPRVVGPASLYWLLSHTLRSASSPGCQRWSPTSAPNWCAESVHWVGQVAWPYSHDRLRPRCRSATAGAHLVEECVGGELVWGGGVG